MGPALDVLAPLAFWLFLAVVIAQLGRQDDARTLRLLSLNRAARLRRYGR